MRLHLLQEPTIQFHSGTHIDVRAGLLAHGVFDRGRDHVPTPIGLGLIGTTATTDGVRDWIERCQNGVASLEEKYRELRPDFPGVTDAIFGTTFSMSDTSTRAISRHELRSALNESDPLAAVVELFLEHAKDLASRSGIHVLIIAPPYEVFELADLPPKGQRDTTNRRSPGKKKKKGAAQTSDDALDDASQPEVIYKRNFHDLFKAQGLSLQAPSQLLRPDTYGMKPPKGKGYLSRKALQGGATRAWNFHTALYYKAGGVPWRLVRDKSRLATCYVGASFYKSLDGQKLMTSVAQVFDERGEGLIVQGGSARIERRDRTSHLLPDDAKTLLANGLKVYRREHRTMPARVVVHKTSYFDPDEIDGFRAAAQEQNVEFLDLVAVRRGSTRLFLASTKAVPRGTTLTFADPTGVLCLKGTVPYFRLYPGMYVPRPLEFTRDDGETSPLQLARELLQLSKLNFNNTQFDSGDPITIRAARRVGDILKNVEPGEEITSRFRYFT